MRTLSQPAPVDPKAFSEWIRGNDAILLDARSYPAFSGLHIPGSWHIDLSGNFATQAGWILPPGLDILLVVESRDQAEEAALQLRRVGFDRVPAFLEGGMLAWGSSNLPISRVPVVSAGEAHSLVSSGGAILVDVRSWEEWGAGHADGAVHIPWHDLRTRHAELDPARHTIVMCKGGQRGSIAASILKMHGFEAVSNLAGGFLAYQRAGFSP